MPASFTSFVIHNLMVNLGYNEYGASSTHRHEYLHLCLLSVSRSCAGRRLGSFRTYCSREHSRSVQC